MRWYNRTRGGQHPNDLITANEVACFAYCPEQRRLQYALGLPAENQAAREAGTRHHSRKAVAERVADWSIRLGLALFLVALVLLGLWMLS